MVRFGVPGQNIDTLSYADGRLATVPAIQAPRRPTVNDKKYPLWCEWRTNKEASSPAEEGEFWKLIRFESNGDATWVMLSGGDEDPILTIETDDGAPNVIPDVNGDVQILGGTGISVTGQGPGNTVTVALSGGDQAVDQIDIDFNTAPGTDPVLADANGQISIYGNTVTNATNANSPVATHSRAVNQFHVDVQLGTAVAATPADPYDAGLVSMDNQYFTTDANGFTALAARMLQYPIGTTINLGISYSSPTFTIHGSDGTALSATNPAFVVMPDNATKGQKKVFSITSNYTFEDDSGTSDLTGNLWGTTTGVVWSQNIPFYGYFVINDANDAVTPMIGRNHAARVSPATIGKPSSAIADAEVDFWAIDDGITVGDYDTNPAVRVFAFRMTKNDAANNDWTVTALDNKDGVGRTNFGRSFVFEVLQNGATSRYLSSSVGGDTIPTFNTDSYSYTLLEDGWVNIVYNTTNITNTPSGAGTLRLHLPIQARQGSWVRNNAGFSFDDSSLSNGTVPGSIYQNSAPTQSVQVRSTPDFGTASTVLTPGTLANGDGNFSWRYTYRGFIE